MRPLPLHSEETLPGSPPSRGRRRVLGGLLAAAIGAAGAVFGREGRAQGRMWLRPPGALAEERFLDECARCFQCASVCPNNCIQLFGLADGLDVAFTPYLAARERGCILCGACAEACPTGALRPFEANRDGWLAGVEMGLARVNKEMCYSFHGRTCGACYRACPLAGKAMTIGVFETPHIHAEHCVGCGLCEQACLHLPQAIRVIPRRMLGPLGAARRERAA